MQNVETKIYSYLVITGLIESFLYVAICFLADFFYSPETHFIFVILNKCLCGIYILWMTFLFYYIARLTTNLNDTGNRRLTQGLLGIDIVFFFTIIISPIELYLDPVLKISNADGLAINILYAVCTLYLLGMILAVVLNAKKIKAKEKLIPYYALFSLFTVSLIIRAFDPYFNITSNVFSFVLLIMYFTIENPDMKLIKELNIARDQAEKANNAKTEFLSSMSHEIRTPLNAIVGFSQNLATDDTLPEDAKGQIKDILMASDNLLDIVNGILDISKIEANKLEIINTEYEFKKIVEELMILTKTKIGEKPIELRVSIDPGIPPVMYGDHIRLKQVILNLLTNAAKYTNEGWIEFKVNCVKKGDVCRLIISVEDTGRGIKPENIDKLFTKFERLQIEKSSSVEGTGLGLAITKRLTELMGGKIVVQSIYEKGSKFTIGLDQRIVAKTSLETVKKTTGKLTCSNKKVLVVDDNSLNLKVAERLLKTYGLIIDTIDSGEKAIEKIRKGDSYDLILMDDMMPHLSGTNTLKKLKENPNFQIPTVALTANAISGMREKYISEGFDDYLAKPINKQELEEILNKFLN